MSYLAGLHPTRRAERLKDLKEEYPRIYARISAGLAARDAVDTVTSRAVEAEEAKPAERSGPTKALDQDDAAGLAPIDNTAQVESDWSPTDEEDPPVLTFSPRAWLKLQFMCHRGDTEVGGFGVARDPENLLYVHDFYTVPQECTSVTVAFDDVGTADYTEDRVLEGLKPDQILRIWIHTHPGSSPTPSGTDEDTFKDKFGDCDWAIMFILAKYGATYARLKIKGGKQSLSRVIGVAVDWTAWAEESAQAAKEIDSWRTEYEKNVTARKWSFGGIRNLSREAREANAHRFSGTYQKRFYGGDRPQYSTPIGGPPATARHSEDASPRSGYNYDDDGFGYSYTEGLGDLLEEREKTYGGGRPNIGSPEWASHVVDPIDLLDFNDEDLWAMGITQDEVRSLRKGERIEGMTDLEYEDFKHEYDKFFGPYRINRGIHGSDNEDDIEDGAGDHAGVFGGPSEGKAHGGSRKRRRRRR